MPPVAWGWEITPEELSRWTLVATPELLAINKPGGVVCHPSKQGPWSSLVGACREYLGVATLHMPSRLDRETSGVVVLARTAQAASRLQTAIERRTVRKTYYAILQGVLAQSVTVDQPLARDESSSWYTRRCVASHGQSAVTEFVPLASGGGWTLVRVHPLTGRLHQIRVHAAWLGHAIAGDKLYGPDPTLMHEFVAHGFSPRLQAALPLPRHALHAAELTFFTDAGEEPFVAPLPEDLQAFCRDQMGLASLAELGVPLPSE